MILNLKNGKSFFLLSNSKGFLTFNDSSFGVWSIARILFELRTILFQLLNYWKCEMKIKRWWRRIKSKLRFKMKLHSNQIKNEKEHTPMALNDEWRGKIKRKKQFHRVIGHSWMRKRITWNHVDDVQCSNCSF